MRKIFSLFAGLALMGCCSCYFIQKEVKVFGFHKCILLFSTKSFFILWKICIFAADLH